MGQHGVEFVHKTSTHYCPIATSQSIHRLFGYISESSSPLTLRESDAQVLWCSFPPRRRSIVPQHTQQPREFTFYTSHLLETDLIAYSVFALYCKQLNLLIDVRVVSRVFQCLSHDSAAMLDGHLFRTANIYMLRVNGARVRVEGVWLMSKDDILYLHSSSSCWTFPIFTLNRVSLDICATYCFAQIAYALPGELRIP